MVIDAIEGEKISIILYMTKDNKKLFFYAILIPFIK